jgi:hypothetical protein
MTLRILGVPLLVGAAAAFVGTRAPASDSDLFWHLAVGRDIATGGLVRVDHFSWSVPGHAVLTDQWLGQLALYLAYSAGGWLGIVALRGLVVAVLSAAVAYAALREQPARPLLATLIAIPAIALSSYVWTDRPELVGLACFTILIVLLRGVSTGSFRAMVAIPPLMLIWANVHGSVTLGLALVVIVCAEAFARLPSRRQALAVVAVLSLAATLLTPAGLAGWRTGGLFFTPPRFIQEWGTPDVATVPGALFALSFFATLVVALYARGGLREAAVLVPVAFVSLVAARFTPLFAIAATPYLAAHVPLALSRLPPPLRFSLQTARPAAPPMAASIGASLLALVVLVGALVTGPRSPGIEHFPVGALPLLPAGPGLLNRYDWGGFLIWYAPATPVFVDGRLLPYLDGALDDYRAVIGLHSDWREVIARRGIRTLLVAPTDAVAVHARDLGWRVLASAPDWVLLAVP